MRKGILAICKSICFLPPIPPLLSSLFIKIATILSQRLQGSDRRQGSNAAIALGRQVLRGTGQTAVPLPAQSARDDGQQTTMV